MKIPTLLETAMLNYQDEVRPYECCERMNYSMGEASGQMLSFRAEFFNYNTLNRHLLEQGYVITFATCHTFNPEQFLVVLGVALRDEGIENTRP